MILLFFMDGLKYDMAKRHMPFLMSLNNKPLKSEFGYSCACHATMYTGRHIDEHNTWFVWKKGDFSPYRWVEKIPALKYMNILPIKAAVTAVTRLFCKNTSLAGIPMLVNLPLKYWHYFEPCEKCFWSDDGYMPKHDTLFKVLKRQGIPHSLVGFSKGGDAFAEEKSLDYRRNEFIYYFLGGVDGCIHHYGENAPESAAYLKKTDDFIRSSCERAARTGKPVTVICYSDHGHIDVEGKLDINTFFKAQGLDINNYIHLVESTFARFWFRNDGERNQVVRVMESMAAQGLGFAVDDEMKRKYHLCFDSTEHGEYIFHLSAPNIFTNTIWGYGRKQKSMHGYLPELEKHYGIFASDKKISEREFVYLTDIFPTLLCEMGIDVGDLTGEAILIDGADCDE